MIVVLGWVEGAPEVMDELLAAALEHVRRSRTEPGCVSHGVAIDAENPNRLLFTERWAGPAELQAHFEVLGSGAFVAAARRLTDGRLGMDVYPVTAPTG